MADKYINATKLIERLKEERTHSLASEAWNPALVGTMLELKTKHILGEIISVLEEEPAADVVPCPAPNWPICQNCGKPMVSRKAGSAMGEKTDTGSKPDYIEEPTVTDKTIGGPASVDKTIGGRRKRTVLKARKGNIILVPEDEAVIGRQKDTDYSELLEDCSLISRRHGKFMKRGRDWYIVDFGSTNGTLVNDVELEPDKPVRFSPGDVVDIGTYIFDVVEQ